jgi:hypothetical protein
MLLSGAAGDFKLLPPSEYILREGAQIFAG